MTPLDTLKQIRKDYPTPMSREQTGMFLNRFCLAHPNYAMYSKPDGNSAIAPDGETISRDIVVDLSDFKGYDTLVDSEGEAIPCWEFNAHHVTDKERIKLPVTGAPVPVPTPIPPTPIPPPVVEVPQPPVTSYNQFLAVEMPLLRAAYREKHDREPAPSDSDHLSYRRLVERWTIVDMVEDI